MAKNIGKKILYLKMSKLLKKATIATGKSVAKEATLLFLIPGLVQC